MRPLVKICGVRRVEDARLAVALGADLIGCVLAGDSPRRARMADVRRIHCAIEGRAGLVLVFRHATLYEAVAACANAGTDRVQVQCAGGQLLADLVEVGLRPFRVQAVPSGAAALPRIEPAPTDDCPLLLDTGSGGSGLRFDWRLLAPRAPAATFVAGGITPANLPELLPLAPYGIDLASGVESAPGVKDPRLLAALFAHLEAA